MQWGLESRKKFISENIFYNFTKILEISKSTNYKQTRIFYKLLQSSLFLIENNKLSTIITILKIVIYI